MSLKMVAKGVENIAARVVIPTPKPRGRNDSANEENGAFFGWILMRLPWGAGHIR
jgi:hypothetical protein